MRPFSAFILTALSIASGACQQQADITAQAQAKTAATVSTAANPVVVELYQSQGCSSCPPANAALNAVANKPGVIALSFAVTYWDRLGWKDIFADKSYTQRQYDYAHALGNANVATPQIIINGKTAITGIKQGELAKSIAAAAPLPNTPQVTLGKNGVSVGDIPGWRSGSANVWLVRYDPRSQNVAIRSGENTGRTLPHKNIVRSLVKLGEWKGTATTFKMPVSADSKLETVILVQRSGAGPIIAAKKI